MGLQISFGLGNEVSLRGFGRRRRSAVQGAAARDCPFEGDADLCGVDQPESRAHADLDPAQPFGIAGGAISEGAEFA